MRCHLLTYVGPYRLINWFYFGINVVHTIHTLYIMAFVKKYINKNTSIICGQKILDMHVCDICMCIITFSYIDMLCKVTTLINICIVSVSSKWRNGSQILHVYNYPCIDSRPKLSETEPKLFRSGLCSKLPDMRSVGESVVLQK